MKASCIGLLLFGYAYSLVSFSQPRLPAGPEVRAAASPQEKRVDRVRISQITLEKYIVQKVAPKYPEAARKKKVEGFVRMHILLSETSEILSLDVIEGHPGLNQAALDAVRQWEFKPYLLNGEPVELDSHVTVQFKLAKRAR